LRSSSQSASLSGMTSIPRIFTTLALLTLGACAKPAAQPEAVPAEPESTSASPAAETQPEAGTTQLANPASVNCEQKGGKLEMVSNPDGEQGICVLADGTRCEEWAYLRGECP